MSDTFTKDALQEFNTLHRDNLTRKDIIPCLLTAPDMAGEILRIHRTGLPPRCSTGWVTVDKHYTVAPGQWTLVTGIPGHGKSEWLDALIVNLAEAGDWHFAIYSPENFPQAQHAAKLIEKHLRKPFGRGPNERMSET